MLLAIFQNFLDNRIRILQTLVACSECQLVVRLFIGTQNRLVALHSALFPRLT
jgi:hypothetical protein